MSETVKELVPALLEAQRETKNVKALKTNPFADYQYADLADVLNAVKGPLNNNGIVIVQAVKTDPNIVVTTRLQHVSGEYIETDFAVPPVENKKSNPVQAMGAGITYARRYSLAALLGITSEEDTDGQGIKGKDKPPPPPSTQEQSRQKLINDIGEVIKKANFTDREREMYRAEIRKKGEEGLNALLSEVKKAAQNQAPATSENTKGGEGHDEQRD